MVSELRSELSEALEKAEAEVEEGALDLPSAAEMLEDPVETSGEVDISVLGDGFGPDSWEDTERELEGIELTAAVARGLGKIQVDDEIAAEKEATSTQRQETHSNPLVQQMDGKVQGGEVPPWAGVRWRSIAAEDRVEAWEGLREWVDWFTRVHKVPKNVVPSCWFLHEDVVEILWAMMNAELNVWSGEAGAATTGPMLSWHMYLPGFYEQLKNRVQTCTSGVGGHNPDKVYTPGVHPFVRELDEQLWQDYIAGSEVTIGDLGEGAWRVAVKKGESVQAGQVLTLGQVPATGPVDLGDVFVMREGSSAPYLFFRPVGQDAEAVAEVQRQVGGAWVAAGEEYERRLGPEPDAREDLRERLPADVQAGVEAE